MARRGSSGGGLGIGVIGFLALVGMCMSDDSSSDYSSSLSAVNTAAVAPSEPPPETFYAHGALNVRSGPGKEHSIVRTVKRGDVLRLGPKNSNGWATSYTASGTSEGYLYRASDLVKSAAPAARTNSSKSSASSGRSRRSSAESRGYYTGPRGGCYTYSASGRKRYVDRSYCN